MHSCNKNAKLGFTALPLFQAAGIISTQFDVNYTRYITSDVSAHYYTSWAQSDLHDCWHAFGWVRGMIAGIIAACARRNTSRTSIYAASRACTQLNACGLSTTAPSDDHVATPGEPPAPATSDASQLSAESTKDAAQVGADQATQVPSSALLPVPAKHSPLAALQLKVRRAAHPACTPATRTLPSVTPVHVHTSSCSILPALSRSSPLLGLDACRHQHSASATTTDPLRC